MVLLSDAKKLIDPEESHSKVEKQPLMEKYRIPVQHFEYCYIEKCKDGRELEKIVQVLRSGEEGYFPDLARFAENRLAAVKPKSKLLRSLCPVISKEALGKDERNQITSDLTQWVANVSKDDDELAFFKNRKSDRDSLPQVREIKETVLEEKKKSVKRISSTDYSSWDKYDPDTEILKMDLQEQSLKESSVQKEKKKSTTKKTVQFKEFTTDVEALHEANYEKDKGNEFFKSGDYKEALKHYTNSINCKPTLASFTNRALTNIKLKKFQSAIDDCHSALAIDPDNVKSFLRKSQALEGLGRHREAFETVEQAIEIDPNNTLAQELADRFRNQCTGAPQKSTRFVVEDIGGQETSASKKDKDGVIIPIPGTSNMSPPHYITCSDDNPEKVREETIRANTPIQIVHLISVDNSDADDDDCCTVNHLEKICSGASVTESCRKVDVGEKNEENKDSCSHDKISLQEIYEKIPTEREEIAQVNKTSRVDHLGNSHNLDSHSFDSNVNSEANEHKTKVENKQQETRRTNNVTYRIIKEDKCAGGEPYVKQNECADVPDDIHSPYSFLRTWNSANSDRTLEQHATILRSIDMTRIAHVIGCKLDSAMFSTIVKCLCVHFAVPGEVDRLHLILENIVHLPRFDIISMLMSSDDRNRVNRLVNFLKQHGKPVSQHVINKFFNN